MKLEVPKSKIRNKIGEGTIYVIKNVINGKIYVGQTEETDYINRLAAHIRNAENGKDGYFYKSIRKYGLENFILLEIKYVDLSELDNWEYTYIKYYNSLHPDGYNALPYGQLYSGAGYWLGRKRSPETIAKVAAKLSIKYRAEGNPFYGKHHSKETIIQANKKRSEWWSSLPRDQKEELIKKWSESHKGLKPSEETKEKISKANSGKVRTEKMKEHQRQLKLGKRLSKEHAENISKALKGHKKKDTSKMVAAQRARVSPEAKERVRKIHELSDKGLSNKDIAAEVGCGYEYVRKVRKGQRGGG